MSAHHSTPDPFGVTVYFVQAGESGPIKIGQCTGDPKRRLAIRLSMLQVGNHEKLRLLGTCTRKRSIEKRLHRRFAHLRIRGEWFEPTGELIGFIARHATPPDEYEQGPKPEIIWNQGIRVADLTPEEKRYLENLGLSL